MQNPFPRTRAEKQLTQETDHLMNINVAIVDDNGGAREGLAALVRMTPGHTLVSICKTGRSALVELPRTKPSVVLIEMNLRDLPGPDCIRRLRTLIPGVEIIAFTAQPELPRILAAMAAGAHGYLLKDSPPQRVLDAIREVAAGGAPMAPSIARYLVERLYQEHAGAQQNGARPAPHRAQQVADRRRRQDGAGEPRPGLGSTDRRASEQDDAHWPARAARALAPGR